MTDRDLLADEQQRIAAGLVGPIVRHVQHRAILDARASAPTRIVLTSPRSTAIGQTDIVAELDAPDHAALRIDVDTLSERGRYPAVRAGWVGQGRRAWRSDP